MRDLKRVEWLDGWLVCSKACEWAEMMDHLTAHETVVNLGRPWVVAKAKKWVASKVA